jgi:hypothetical protein
MNRRPLHFITRERELELIQRLQTLVNVENHTSENSAVLMVSPDYSATVAMHLAHGWSNKGDIINIIPVEVPYPDEAAEPYIQSLMEQISQLMRYQKLILVEAGIIRGSNWTWILKILTEHMGFKRDQITLVAMCENIHSTVKSDYVAEYYDDDKEELMFYFEKFNKHWKIR